MNKNVSLILNAVLLIAVAVLYYFHFTSCTTSCEAVVPGSDTAAVKPVVLSPKDIKASKIVYVNMDVLNESYDYLKDITSSARSEHQSLESQYQSQGQKLQEDYMLFQQKMQEGLLSENQANTEQEAFMKRKEKIDQLELKSQKLMERIQLQAEEANTNLKDYLKEYNKNSDYNYVLAYSEAALSPVILADSSLDITKEILDGLNAQYKAKKESKKK